MVNEFGLWLIFHLIIVYLMKIYAWKKYLKMSIMCLQLAVVRQVLRKELGLKIVEVDSEKACLEGSDVLWTG